MTEATGTSTVPSEDLRRRYGPPPGQLHRRRRRRALRSLAALVVVLAIGTIGFAWATGSGWVNAFYFESMLATGQGPPFPLTTAASKLFASAMAFLSVGTVVTALILNLGPMVGRLWREGTELAEREVRVFERELVGRNHDSESLDRREKG